MKRVVYLFMFIMVISLKGYSKDFVSYELNGGRFGDSLLTYLHSKWIAYKYNLDILYKPFEYSNKLILDQEEISYFSAKKQKFFKKEIVFLSEDLMLKNNLRRSKAYKISYFPEDLFCLKNRGSWRCFCVDWKDKGFRKEIERLITPISQVKTLDLSGDVVNVAFHIREGGDFDLAEVKKVLPTKFLPISFYKKALVKLLDFFPNKQISFYIFTDANDPEIFVEELNEVIPENLKCFTSFEYRNKGNAHDQNVLEDFFSLFLFDVIVRPESNFSVIPTLINDYAFIGVFNLDFFEDHRVDEVLLEKNEVLYEALMERVPDVFYEE